MKMSITKARSSTPTRDRWDWIGLIASIIASTAVPIFGIWFSVQQAQIAAGDQNQQAMLSYIDQMTTLIVEKKLLDSSNPESENSYQAKSIVLARTQNTLRQLDPQRKGQLLKFLYDINLIGGGCQTAKLDKPVISKCSGKKILHLNGTKLDQTTFDRPIPPLAGIDLAGTVLFKASLPGADLTGADMQGVILESATLTDAVLTEANLQGANLTNADLRRADLRGADLRDADLKGSNLQDAKLQGAVFSTATKSPTKFPEGFSPLKQGMHYTIPR
jgi:uncharacterized protein YjbI with pentapeptide repeats